MVGSSWITSKPAGSGKVTNHLETGQASLTLENGDNAALWERFLTFTKHFYLKKVAPAMICLTFKQRTAPDYL